MQLTESEKLKLENLALKKEILSIQFQELKREQATTFHAVCKRIGEDPGNVSLNYISGEITIINKKGTENENS